MFVGLDKKEKEKKKKKSHGKWAVWRGVCGCIGRKMLCFFFLVQWGRMIKTLHNHYKTTVTIFYWKNIDSLKMTLLTDIFIYFFDKKHC